MMPLKQEKAEVADIKEESPAKKICHSYDKLPGKKTVVQACVLWGVCLAALTRLVVMLTGLL